MRLKKFALLGIAALSMAACSNSDEIGSDAGNPQGGDSWASFVINLPKTSISSRAETVIDEGTADELKVTGARVVLYDEAKSQVQYSFDYAVTADGSNPAEGNDLHKPNGKAGFVTKAKKVKKANYNVLVLLNPLQAVKDVTVPGRNFNDFTKAAKVTVDELTKNGFFMSNEQDLVALPQDKLKATAEEAQETPLKVAVDRAVAKVTVTGADVKVPEGSKDEVSDLEWTLDVRNTQMFWMRQLGELGATGTKEVQGDNSERALRYAVDPNFADKTYPSGEFELEREIPQNLIPVNKDNKKYVLENTMAAVNQVEGQTTRVILKAVYTPDGYTKGEDWFSYLGIRMNLAEFTEYFKKAINDESLTGSNLPVDFAKDMKALLADGTITTDEAGNLLLPNAGFSKNNLNYYKGGVSYYPILIRHFDDTISPDLNGYGRYGVVRNNVYKLNITMIKKPGEPVTPPIDPEGPDDKDNVYVSFDIEILPWVVREQDVIIE